MERPWRWMARGVAAALLGLVASTLVTATAVWTVATRSDLLLASVDDTTLYRLAIPPLAVELRDSDVVDRINTGPLRLTRGDVDRILRARFTPEDVALKAGEVHSGLVRYVRAWPADTVFRISIRLERPILAEAARERVVERFRALPECGFLDDARTLGRAGARQLFGGSSDRDFLRELPDCLPPDAVADGVVEGVRGAFRRMAAEEDDSVDVFPETDRGGLQAYGSRIERLQSVDRYLGREPWLPLLGAVVLLTGMTLAGRRTPVLPDGWALIAAAGVGLLAWTGILHGAAGLPVLILEAFGAEFGTGGEARRLWLELGRYGVDRVLWTAGSLLGVVGFLLVLGAVGRAAARGEGARGKGT